MRCIICLFCFLFVVQRFQAQVNSGINFLPGKILLHTPKIYIQDPGYSQAIEFSYRKQTLGDKIWHQRFGYPEVSLNALFAFNGDARFGYTAGLYPAIQFRLLTFSRGNLFWKFGGGIGLVSKYYNRTPASDSMNNIVGGRVNNVSMFQAGIRINLTPKLSTQGGLFFHHASNASARQPNFGINTYGVFLGVNYHPHTNHKPFIKSKETVRQNPSRVGIRLAYAMAEDKIPDGPMYPYYNITFLAQKRYCGKSNVAIGVDMTYHSKLYAFYKNNYLFVHEERKNAWRYSILVGHEFLFGKIGFPIQLGFYTKRPIGGPIAYQKLGLNYHFYQDKETMVKDLFLLLQLKTHWAQAELAEIGVGILF